MYLGRCTRNADGEALPFFPTFALHDQSTDRWIDPFSLSCTGVQVVGGGLPFGARLWVGPAWMLKL